MTPAGWARVVALWRGVWPDRALPAQSVEVWFDLLGDLDDEEVFAALVEWANDPDRSWPPQSPGEIRAVVDEPDRPWTAAIAELATVVRRTGRYGERPEMVDPALDAYIESMGGWQRLCDRFDSGDPTVRAQFRDHYRTVKTSARKQRSREIGRSILPALGSGDDG